MDWPFVIFGLPRSRTAWLQQWLGGSQFVGHDLTIEANNLQSLLDSLWHGGTGTVETNAQDLAQGLRQAMPGSKFITIRRNIGEVVNSLRNCGIADPLGKHGLYLELARREVELDKIEQELGGLRFDYRQLDDPRACAGLFEYLTGLQFNFDWWQYISNCNIQVNVLETTNRVLARKEEIARLLLEGKNPPRKLTRIGLEPWDSIWADLAEGRGQEWFQETYGSSIPFRLDQDIFATLAKENLLKSLSARVNGRLVGCLAWTLSPMLESQGLSKAHQSIFYVEKNNPGIARKLLVKSWPLLKSCGIRHVELQHGIGARGMENGLVKLGAIPTAVKYSLDLEKVQNA